MPEQRPLSTRPSSLCEARRLTCGNYIGGGFWCDTFEPGVSSEPPECGHEFTIDAEEWGGEVPAWVTCPKCGGEVCTRD